MLNERQIEEYLDRLDAEWFSGPTKASLDELVYAHQTHIPFSTVDLHRAQAAPDLATDAVFDKVISRGRGGYCFELNKLFEEFLRSLGYDARPVLSRVVRGREERMPINHRGMIVSLGSELYSVDVGFGGPMPAGALQLMEDVEQNMRGDTFIAARANHAWWKIDRITKAEHDLHDDGLSARRQTELELCTAPVEDMDFAALNEYCSRPGTLFRDHELVNLRTDNGYRGYRDGVLTLRENGNKTVLELGTRANRDAALEESFGIGPAFR